jgi:hypothetical protein
MFVLMRKEFPDKPLNADRLAALGDLWSSWYCSLRGGALKVHGTSQQLEVRLWGFPRLQAETCLNALRQCATGAGLPGDCASAPNPDTLSLTLPPAPLQAPWPRGAMYAVLTRPDFDAFDVEVRLAVYEGGSKASVPTWTLVVRGLVVNRELLLKALCPAGEDPALERMCQRTAWKAEPGCLQALDEFARTGDATPVPELLPPGRERLRLRHARLLLGDGRFLGFLVRVGCWAGGVAVGVWFLIYHAWGNWLLTALTAVWISSHAASLDVLLRAKAGLIVKRHRRMKAALEKSYTHDVTWPRVDFVAEGVAGNPVAAKYSRELEEAGAMQLFDSRSSSEPKNYVRLYFLPAEHSYLFFNIMLVAETSLYYPARPHWVAHTFFADGHSLVANSSSLKRPRPYVPDRTVRNFPGVRTPQEFLDRYRTVVHELLEAGRQLSPPLTTDEFFAKVEGHRQQAAERARRRGYYSWRQAIADSFRAPDPDEL